MATGQPTPRLHDNGGKGKESNQFTGKDDFWDSTNRRGLDTGQATPRPRDNNGKGEEKNELNGKD